MLRDSRCGRGRNIRPLAYFLYSGFLSLFTSLSACCRFPALLYTLRFGLAYADDQNGSLLTSLGDFIGLSLRHSHILLFLSVDSGGGMARVRCSGLAGKPSTRLE